MTSSSCSGNFQASHIRQCHQFLWSLVPAIVKEESVYRIWAKGWRMTIPPLWSNCCFSQLNGGFIPWKLRPVARADKPRQSAPSSSLLPTKEVSIIVIVHVTKGSCDKMQSKQAFPRRSNILSQYHSASSFWHLGISNRCEFVLNSCWGTFRYN